MKRDALYICPSTLLPDTFAVTEEQFDEYLKACHDADLDGISWWTLHHYLLLGAGMTTEQIKGRLLAHDLDIILTEAMPEWANCASVEVAVEKCVGSIEIAAEYGSPNLAAVVLEDSLVNFDQAVLNLQAIADQAAKVDVDICIEFLGWSGIPNIEVCWDLIQRAERDNVGVLFDSWHWHRQEGGPLGRNAEVLASMPASAVKVLQLCDAGPDPQEDAMAECMASRPLPGQGVVDHAQLFGLLAGIGADPAIVPEVFNTELVAQGMSAMTKAVTQASREVMATWPAGT